MRWQLAPLVLALAGCLQDNPAFVDPTIGMQAEACRDEFVAAFECAHCRSWCAPDSWDDGVPDRDTDVIIEAGEAYVVDCTTAVARSITIQDGGALIAARGESSRLELHGNLVVHGRLDYGTPDDRIRPEITAELVFVPGLDRDVSGTSDGQAVDPPPPSDVGLWVLTNGVVTAAGQPKRSWSVLAAPAMAGDRGLPLTDASGWLPGDELVVAPTFELAGLSANAAVDTQFDEVAIESIEDALVTTSAELGFPHAGGTDLRRAEVANLTRNVVIRSDGDSSNPTQARHAHVFVAGAAIVQLDSVELRWLGPRPRCGDSTPAAERRAALYFFDQGDAADRSFVCHTSIHGGEARSYVQEHSHGVLVQDVVGIDTWGPAFTLLPLGPDCKDDCTSDRTVFTDVLAARIGVPARGENCENVDGSFAAFSMWGGEQTGCDGCAAVGIGRDADHPVAAFHWGADESGRPTAQAFRDNVAHHVHGNGITLVERSCPPRESAQRVAIWSATEYGISWALQGCQSFADVTIEDTGRASIGYGAVAIDERARIDGAVVEDIEVLTPELPYDGLQSRMHSVTASGIPAVFGQENTCVDDNAQLDPQSEAPGCIAAHVVFETLAVQGEPALSLGWAGNRATSWDVRSMQGSTFGDDVSLTLFRSDQQEPGGCAYEPYDAWVVPANGGGPCP